MLIKFIAAAIEGVARSEYERENKSTADAFRRISWSAKKKEEKREERTDSFHASIIS